MHDDRVVVERRILRVLRERLRPAVYTDEVPLAVQVWQAPGEPVPVQEGLDAAYKPARPGDAWGPAWGTTWFHLAGAVPEAWSGRTVEAVLDLGSTVDRSGFSAEGLVYRRDGSVVKGLNPASTWVRIGEPAQGGEEVDLYVEAASNPLIEGAGTPMGDPRTAGDQPLYRLGRAVVAVFAQDVWDLVQDVEVLSGLMHELSTDDPRRWNILRALERAMDALDLQPPQPPPAPFSRLPWPRRPRRARTASAQSATRTSTPRGCGRCARRCARSRGRRPASLS